MCYHGWRNVLKSRFMRQIINPSIQVNYIINWMADIQKCQTERQTVFTIYTRSHLLLRESIEWWIFFYLFICVKFRWLLPLPGEVWIYSEEWVKSPWKSQIHQRLFHSESLSWTVWSQTNVNFRSGKCNETLRASLCGQLELLLFLLLSYFQVCGKLFSLCWIHSMVWWYHQLVWF